MIIDYLDASENDKPENNVDDNDSNSKNSNSNEKQKNWWEGKEANETPRTADAKFVPGSPNYAPLNG